MKDAAHIGFHVQKAILMHSSGEATLRKAIFVRSLYHFLKIPCKCSNIKYSWNMPFDVLSQSKNNGTDRCSTGCWISDSFHSTGGMFDPLFSPTFLITVNMTQPHTSHSSSLLYLPTGSEGPTCVFVAPCEARFSSFKNPLLLSFMSILYK